MPSQASPPADGALEALIFAPHLDDECVVGGLPLRLRRKLGCRVGQAAADVSAMIDKLSGSGSLGIVLVGGIAGPITPRLEKTTRDTLASPKGDALEGALRLAGCPASTRG